MKSIFFILLSFIFQYTSEDDSLLVKRIADKIIESHVTGFRSARTDATYAAAEDIPVGEDIRVRSDYANWHYSTGIINSALLEYTALTGDSKYADYVKMHTDYCLDNYTKIPPMVSPTGDWHPFYGLRRFDELDFVGTQFGSLIEWQCWADSQEYEELIQRAAEHIRHGQIRLDDGTLVRTWSRNPTLWADDLYMGLAFMTRYAQVYGDRQMLEDAIRQVDKFNEYLWNPETSLYWHAWYGETKSVAGAHWGRCNGWILKATVELLDLLEPGTTDYERILGYLHRQVDGLKQYQKKNGMWMQVLDKKSYDESSCTVIMVGSIAHAIRRGWLDTSYSEMVYPAWKSLKSKYIKDGSLMKVCVGTGVMDDAKGYQGRPTKDGDTHGAGLLLYAGTEMLALNTYLSSLSDCLLRPTFNSCTVEWCAPTPTEGLTMEYRKASHVRWQAIEHLPYFKEQPGYRTSIIRLDEDSVYDFRVVIKGKPIYESRFRTWKSDVPVAKTIELDPDQVKYPIRIKAKGNSDGWIRYTIVKGKELKNYGTTPTVIVDGASYVLIDDIVFKGPHRHEGAINVKNSKAVRIRNCEISDWGRIGVMRFDKKGKPCVGETIINFDGAIKVHPGSSEVVIERCYIHDAAGKTNTWRYAHPAGTEAVILYKPDHSTVLRYNDFVGSDRHRFNDAVESFGNFDKDGGFNRDADIYGNFMAFCNDDCIELDGGQRNVRCFDNRFESSLVGISIQGCMTSPSFVFNNVLSGLGDPFNRAGFGIKTGSGEHGSEAKTYIFENYFARKTNGINMMNTLEAHVTNNIFAKGVTISSVDESPQSVIKSNLMNLNLNDEDLPDIYPIRPVPFVLSRQKITNPGGEFTVTIKPLPEMVKEIPFKIRINEDTDWFTVSPSSGIIRPGEDLELKVSPVPENMKDRRYYRGAFLVRTDDGLSRPFTLYQETDFIPPFKAEYEGDVAVYLDPFNPNSGTPCVEEDSTAQNGKAITFRSGSDNVLEWTFKVPKTGRYYILTHGRGKMFSRVEVSVNGGEFLTSAQQTDARYMLWTILAPGGVFNNRIAFYDFKEGETQTLRIRPSSEAPDRVLFIDGFVVTDNPEAFEPDVQRRDEIEMKFDSEDTIADTMIVDTEKTCYAFNDKQHKIVRPNFMGLGANAFAKWVNGQLKYPKNFFNERSQGMAMIQFTVGVDGKVKDVEVLRSSGDYRLDAEVVRVVSMSPDWIPATVDGVVKDMRLTFPVIFGDAGLVKSER